MAPDGVWRIAIDGAKGRKFKARDIVAALEAMGDDTLRKNLLDDPDPRFADLRRNIETEIGRTLIHDLEKNEARLDRIEGIPRRRNFRVLPGGRGS